MSLLKLKKKLLQLDEDLDKTQTLVKKLMKEKEDRTLIKGHPFCYFNHSFVFDTLDKEKNPTCLIVGSFYIKNTSNEVKNDPFILIKITSIDSFKFTGRFLTDSKQHSRGFSWERVYVSSLDPKNHFCLKPINKKKLKQNETLSFHNFQIQIPLHSSIIVEGYAYFDESNDGVSSINSININ